MNFINIGKIIYYRNKSIMKIFEKIIILLLLVAIIIFQRYKISSLNNEIISQNNLYKAIHDSITYYENINKQLVAEKLTIQSSFDNLNKINSQLSKRQKDLLNNIENLKLKNSIINSALIDTRFKLDSLLIVISNNNEINIDTINNVINFNNLSSKDSTFIFDINVNNVMPIKNISPTLMFNSIEIPNRQYVIFYWKDDKKEGYPVSLKVVNSNKYIKVYGMDSYIIPQINKNELNPTFWQKFNRFMKSNGGRLIIFSLGLAGGYIIGVN